MTEYELIMEIKEKWTEFYNVHNKEKFIEKMANYLQAKEIELSNLKKTESKILKELRELANELKKHCVTITKVK